MPIVHPVPPQCPPSPRCRMSVLEIRDLAVEVAGRPILEGL